MPTAADRRRRKPAGHVAAKVSKVARERRRLLAIRSEIEAALVLDLAAVRRVYGERIAHIDGQLLMLEQGGAVQPARKLHRELHWELER